jgi:hypothetical protein
MFHPSLVATVTLGLLVTGDELLREKPRLMLRP